MAAQIQRNGCFVAIVLCSAFWSASVLACTGVAGASGAHKELLGDAGIQSSGDNTGIYQWSAGSWMLVESFYDPNANYYTPNPNDWWVPASGGGGGWGGGGGGDGEQIQSCVPVLPPTIVVGVPFSGGAGLWMIRTGISAGAGGGGGGGGAIYRSPAHRIGDRPGDPGIRCSTSTEEDRMLNAREVISLTTNPYNRRGIWTIRYGGGDSQDWLVTAPFITTLGLVPAGPCKD